MGIESNIKASFRDVKLEMVSIKGQILQLAEELNKLTHVVQKLQSQKSPSSRKKNAVKKRQTKKRG